MGEKPPITDAEFEVVSDLKPHLRDPWWQALPWWKKYVFYFDWKRGLMVGMLSGLAALAALAGKH